MICILVFIYIYMQIAYYNKFTGVDTNLILNFKLSEKNNKNSKLPSNGSIDHLIEDFLEKLQVGFPSTIFTILNTSTKIKRKFEPY